MQIITQENEKICVNKSVRSLAQCNALAYEFMDHEVKCNNVQVSYNLTI